MAGPKARESAPRGQWPPAEKRRIAELPLRAGAKRTAFDDEQAIVRRSRTALWREFWHRIIGGERIGVRRLQIPRQQLVNTVDRMIGDALEHRADIRFGVVVVEFGSAQQAVHRRSSLTTGIAAGE